MRNRILSEIRRLAEANGGRPPGRQTFEAKTGIRYADWYGIYWARWGDEVSEAGFSPNSVQKKLDSGVVLEKIAGAFRHFGRIPTDGELRLYGRTQIDFPSHSTISGHFQGKAALISAIRSIASSRPEYADLLAFLPCESVDRPAVTRISTKITGCVYLLQSGAHFKIGRSDEIERRVKEIRVAMPDRALLVHTITTDDPPGIEAYWHRRFADRRANGEWFKLTASDVLAFKRRRFQ